MKKLIALLLMSVFTTIMSFGQQSKQNYAGSAKNDTLTISMILMDKVQTPVLKNLQTDLAKLMENQNNTTGDIANILSPLKNSIIAYTKEIENRNKNDSLFVTSYFGYYNKEVKTVIQRQYILNIIPLLVAFTFFILFYIRLPSQKPLPVTGWSLLTGLKVLQILVIYYILKELLTLLFNPDYNIIHTLTRFYM